MSEMERIDIKENIIEKEPSIEVVVNLFRHGQSMYSPEFVKAVEDAGYKFEDCFKDSVSAGESDKAHFEGTITQEGEEILRGSIKSFAESINQEEEKILALHSGRSRTDQSTNIILDELKKQGIDIDEIKKKEMSDLQDIKMSVIELMRYVKKNDPSNSSEPWTYWLNMSEEEAENAGIETIKDIKERMNHFFATIDRYAQTYAKKIDKKKLRILAITHDVNILPIMSDFGILKDDIKTGNFFELKKGRDGKFMPSK